MIERAPRDWCEGEAQARLFRAAGITRDEIADLIKETGFELVRTCECNLLGDRYAHLVFADGRRELSVLIHFRADGDSREELRVRVASLKDMQAAEVRVAERTMILVGNVSRDEAMRFATAAAVRFG